MTGQADFTEEEWKTVLQGPTSAGMHVIVSDRGGAVRETMEMARAYTEERKHAGSSQLLDEIVQAKPEMDKERAPSKDEMEANQLQNLRDAVSLIEAKASSDELHGYREFVLGLAVKVAEARKEGFMGLSGDRVSGEEQTAINEIAEALGTEPPPPAPAA